MLENFVLSFKEEQLGLKYPLTKAMYKGIQVHLTDMYELLIQLFIFVNYAGRFIFSSLFPVCGKYLREYPGDTDVLLEVEGVGMPNQRTNIASKIQTMDLSGKENQQLHKKVHNWITPSNVFASIHTHDSIL